MQTIGNIIIMKSEPGLENGFEKNLGF